MRLEKINIKKLNNYYKGKKDPNQTVSFEKSNSNLKANFVIRQTDSDERTEIWVGNLNNHIQSIDKIIYSNDGEEQIRYFPDGYLKSRIKFSAQKEIRDSVIGDIHVESFNVGKAQWFDTNTKLVNEIDYDAISARFIFRVENLITMLRSRSVKPLSIKKIYLMQDTEIDSLVYDMLAKRDIPVELFHPYWNVTSLISYETYEFCYIDGETGKIIGCFTQTVSSNHSK